MRTCRFWNYPMAKLLLPNQCYKHSYKRTFFLGHPVDISELLISSVLHFFRDDARCSKSRLQIIDKVFTARCIFCAVSIVCLYPPLSGSLSLSNIAVNFIVHPSINYIALSPDNNTNAPLHLRSFKKQSRKPYFVG